MLDERWRKLAAERGNEFALRDTASGRHWTFGELLAAGEAWPVGATGTVFPKGHSPEFIFILLAAWRENKIACPLEAGQGGASVLASRAIISLAPSIVHLKSTSATRGMARFVAFPAAQPNA